MINKVTNLFEIKYPIVQGGMVWCSGWRLASAVSNFGGLGLLGSGSMYPGVLREHIIKAKKATSNVFGVNLPLLYPNIEEHIRIIIEEGVKVVFTSAGSPKKWTKLLQKEGIKVAHVVSSSKFAVKCEEAGVDAIVAEGFEAGGHNGREETTSLCLIPEVRKVCSLPLIAAGGFGSGQSLLAAMVLGADAVQMGSRFAIAEESSAHDKFKNAVIKTEEGGTKLMLKQLAPTRLLKNKFYEEVAEAEKQGASVEELKKILGKGKAKQGMFLGDVEKGELEIGQIASQIKSLERVEDIFKTILKEFKEAVENANKFSL